MALPGLRSLLGNLDLTDESQKIGQSLLDALEQQLKDKEVQVKDKEACWETQMSFCYVCVQCDF